LPLANSSFVLEHSAARFDLSHAVHAGNLPSHFTLADRHREHAATGLLTRSSGVSRTMSLLASAKE
jgi:hypothetical protein